MLRRRFLQKTSVAFAGSIAAGSRLTNVHAATISSDDAADQDAVLITAAESQLSRSIAKALSDFRTVRLTAMNEINTPFSFTRSSLDSEASAQALLDGIDAVVHTGFMPPSATDAELIDFRTRVTHNLLRAAVHKGVRRFVYLSSMEIMLGYDRQFMIDENFEPQPTSRTPDLSHWLGEYTCREFARSGELKVTVLRLGRLEQSQHNLSSADELPLARNQDICAAVVRVLTDDRDGNARALGFWNVIHVHSQAESDRFPLAEAQRLLHFQPQTEGGGS